MRRRPPRYPPKTATPIHWLRQARAASTVAGPFHGRRRRSTPGPAGNCSMLAPAAAGRPGHPHIHQQIRRQALPAQEPGALRGPPPGRCLPRAGHRHTKPEPSCGLQLRQGSKAEATQPHGVNGHGLARWSAELLQPCWLSPPTPGDRATAPSAPRALEDALIWAGALVFSPDCFWAMPRTGASAPGPARPVRRSKPSCGAGAGALSCLAGDQRVGRGGAPAAILAA